MSDLKVLTDLIGFDPAQHDPITASAFAEAKATITAEREAQAKAKAEEVLREALSIAEEANKLETEFKRARAALIKKLHKVLGPVKKIGGPDESEEEVGA